MKVDATVTTHTQFPRQFTVDELEEGKFYKMWLNHGTAGDSYYQLIKLAHRSQTLPGGVEKILMRVSIDNKKGKSYVEFFVPRSTW